MSKSLADILGWEDGAVYKYGSIFFKVEHDMLLSSLTEELDVWYLDVPVSLKEITYLRKASKVEPKKYYLKHKYLTRVGIPQDLFLAKYGKDDCNLILVLVFDYEPLIQNHLIFTEDEIEKIEASGFDLCNFERIEVEND